LEEKPPLTLRQKRITILFRGSGKRRNYHVFPSLEHGGKKHDDISPAMLGPRIMLPGDEALVRIFLGVNGSRPRGTHVN